MNKAAIIIVSALLAMVVGLSGCVTINLPEAEPEPELAPAPEAEAPPAVPEPAPPYPTPPVPVPPAPPTQEESWSNLGFGLIKSISTFISCSFFSVVSLL